MRFIVSGLMMLCMGCGTVLQGKYINVPINTTPSEALVKLPDLLEDEPTPTRVKIERGQSYLVEITKPGFKEKWIVLQKRKSRTVIFANIFFTAGIGLFVDWYTGRWYGVTPSRIDIFLDPVSHLGESEIVPLQLTESSIIIHDEAINMKIYEINDGMENKLIYSTSG